MAVSDQPGDQARLEQAVGHPGDRFEALLKRIARERIRTFAAVERDFLDLIWCLDKYRIDQVVPRGMGNADLAPPGRLAGIYRGKGNYFSGVVIELLSQRTTSRLASRKDVRGFSQDHQIDVAWPARAEEPLRDVYVCCEAKLTGAPAYPGRGERKAKSDWTNRRKELKFQAADLKLWRQATDTRILNWDNWRRKAHPAVYAVWAARLGRGESITYMIEQARNLGDTYSDGVGIYAFQRSGAGDGYESAPVPTDVAGRVTSIDSVLGMIAARISEIMEEHNNQVPEPVVPPAEPAAQAP